MTTPPSYLLHDFDPRAVKVADLRGILLAHDVCPRRFPRLPGATVPDSDLPRFRATGSVRFERQKVRLGRRIREEHQTSGCRQSDLFISRRAPRASPKLTSQFLVQRLLADLQAVRASDHGVLDGESQGSSLRELDTDYERDGDLEADEDQARSRKKTKSRAAKSDARAAKGDKSKGKGKGKGKGKVVEQDDTTATDEDSADAAAAPPPKKRSRKAARPDPVDAMEVDEPVDLAYEEPVEYEAPLRDEYDTEDDEAPRVSSPKKRKVCSPRCRPAAIVTKSETAYLSLQATEGGPATPRLSDITAAARKGRVSVGAGGGDGNFSDYNPFQSGGEDTPMRDTKRRKVRNLSRL